MNGFPKYGSIENLYRSNEVLEHRVVCTEKLHGTNVRFMWDNDNGGLVLGSRNNIIYKDGQKSNQDGYNFTDFMENHPVAKALSETPVWHKYVFYGEFHGSNIQKGVKYADEKDLRIFDIRDPEENFIDWNYVVSACHDYWFGLKTVPVLLEGHVTLDDLNEFREQNSVVAQQNGFELEENVHEGMVIKPLKEKANRRGNRLIAKYKSDKFAENAKAAKVRKPDPELGAVQTAAREFSESVVTEGRVHTIIDHITRDGNTTIAMSRTGEFLRAFINDVKDEHKEVYAQLDKKQQNIYNKTVNGVASTLWKKYVMEQ